MAYTVTWIDEQLNKNEINKLKKDGLAIFDDLPELIKKPFSEISKDYYMYFKYAGLTVQKPQEQGLFMLRIKIPGGIITVSQARVIADIATVYGHGFLDITTRQSVQFHWIPFVKLVQIFAQIEAVGLTTLGAEGDITRNVITNPLSGLDKNEIFDTSPTVKRLHQRFQNNSDYSNLPRKLKISVNGNTLNSANAEINDIAFVPAVKNSNGRKVYGYNVKIGGGLGLKPTAAINSNIFVLRKQAADVAEAIVALYRDYGYRQNRARARLKFLLQDWGIEHFEMLLRKSVPGLATAGKELSKGWDNGTSLGIHEQKQPGLYYLGVSIPTGRLSAQDLLTFADLSSHFGTNELRFDHGQNLLLPNIKSSDLKQITADPIFQRFPLGGCLLSSYALTCTGNEYCNFAFTRTKDFLHELTEFLDREITLPLPVRIILTGCGNGCAHRDIADIGLQGIAVRGKNNEPQEAFMLSLGGQPSEWCPFCPKNQWDNSLNSFAVHTKKPAFIL